MEKPCMDVYHHIGDLERANAWSFELLCVALLWDFFLKSGQPFYLVAVSKAILFPVLGMMAQREPVYPGRQSHTYHK